ncbi:MAG: transposase [Rhodobacteraceae bacterium]|nr:transposase [Paracoccaceae bacterium]
MAARADQAGDKMNADRTVLTDEMWARVAPLCPGQVTDPGCTAVDNRLCLEGVLWRFRTGTPWRDLPPHFGRWNSVFKRFRRWTKANLCERIVKA